MKRKSLRRLSPFILVMVFATACGGGVSAPEMTAQALGQSIAQTATAAASSSVSAQDVLETAVAQATASANIAAATQAAQAGLNAEAMAAAGGEDDGVTDRFGLDPALSRIQCRAGPAPVPGAARLLCCTGERRICLFPEPLAGGYARHTCGRAAVRALDTG